MLTFTFWIGFPFFFAYDDGGKGKFFFKASTDIRFDLVIFNYFLTLQHIPIAFIILLLSQHTHLVFIIIFLLNK